MPARVAGPRPVRFPDTQRIDRFEFLLRLRQLLLRFPPFQQGLALRRFQLPHPPPAQMLLRFSVDALGRQAPVIHPRRVAVLLQVGVLHLGPALPGFQQPFFRPGAVLSASASFGIFSRCTA